MSEGGKHPGGRPTKYEPWMCDRAEELGAAGKSRAQIAAKFGVCKDTIYEWAHVHPEFSDALTRAKTFEQAYWEGLGESGLFLDKFNSAVWVRSMAARFRDDYTDRQHTENTTNVNVTDTSPRYTEIELARRMLYWLDRVARHQNGGGGVTIEGHSNGAISNGHDQD